MSSIPHWSPETDRDWYLQTVEALSESHPNDPDYWAKQIRYWRASRALWANDGDREGIRATTEALLFSRYQHARETKGTK